MANTNVQTKNLNRVKSKIAPIIVEFFNDKNSGYDFHMEELQKHVGKHTSVSPDSPSRILRDLRKKGILDYEIISRSKSHYRFKGFTRPNSLEHLGLNSLEEYYETEHWINFKEDYFRRHPKVCCISGFKNNIQLHHINYDNLGEEKDEDVVPLHRFWHNFVHYLVKKRKVKLSEAHLVAKETFLAVEYMRGLYPTGVRGER